MSLWDSILTEKVSNFEQTLIIEIVKLGLITNVSIICAQIESINCVIKLDQKYNFIFVLILVVVFVGLFQPRMRLAKHVAHGGICLCEVDGI